MVIKLPIGFEMGIVFRISDWGFNPQSPFLKTPIPNSKSTFFDFHIWLSIYNNNKKKT